MNKKNRKDKQQPKSKNDTFLKWYERERRHSKLTFVKVCSAVVLLIVCVVLAQEWAIAQIGDGASKYNETTYDELKTIIEQNVTNVAIDEKNLKESVDHYTVSYSKGGSTILSCDKVDGFFTAEARISLDNDYNITGSERNYHSVDEYLDYYWLVFRFMGYGIGIGAFLGIMLGWNGILWLTAFALKKIKAKKEKPSKAETEADHIKSAEEGSHEEDASGINLLPDPQYQTQTL